MKNLLLAITFVLFSGLTVSAQKFCYVDTELILSKMTEYQEAQKQLDGIAAEWQKDIEKKYTEIDDMYKAYQADQVLLSEDMRQKRENEIIEKEKSLKAFQKKKFGPKGELFNKREELVKPIQDKVYAEIQKLAKQRSYDFILDKSSGSFMLYANDEYDKTNVVLKNLGIKVN